MTAQDVQKPYSKWYSTYVILALCLGSIAYGYDYSIISTTVGQPGFYKALGLTTDPTDEKLYSFTTAMIGTIFGLFSTGAIFGAIFTGWICDAHGRRPTLMVACIVNIVGGAIQTGSVHVAMFIIGRFVTGFAAAIFVTLVPIYIAEIAPPAKRGFLVGQHGAFFVLGYATAAWVGVACFFSSNTEFQWRFALSLQILWPIIMSGVVSYIPESPRWLVTQGRTEEAWDVLARLHYDPKDATQHFAREEFYQISTQVATDKAAYGDFNVLDLFRKRHFLKRMLISALVMYMSQTQGNLVIYSNIVSLVSGLGYNNAQSLILSGGFISTGCVMSFVNSTYLDRLGRVKSMLIGLTGANIVLCVMVGVIATYTGTDNTAALKVGIASFFFFLAFWAGFCDTTIYVYCSEIFPTHLRAKGMAWSIAVFMQCSTAMTEGSTTGYARLGTKFNIIFIVLTAINIVLIWWFVPETKGLSLEEINGLFGEEVSVQLTNITKDERIRLDALIGGVSIGAKQDLSSPPSFSNEKSGAMEKNETV